MYYYYCNYYFYNYYCISYDYDFSKVHAERLSDEHE